MTIIKTTVEVQEHVPLITVNNNFAYLRPYLKIARRFVTRIIGEEVYTLASRHYNSANYTNVSAKDYNPPVSPSTIQQQHILLDQLVAHIQDPLCFYALFLYSPAGNITLTDAGYQVTWNENSRPAQEWQLDKTEASLLETAHTFIDFLIDFLDANQIKIDPWPGSENEKRIRSRFIKSAADFRYNINSSSRIFFELQPIIQEVERVNIIPALRSQADPLLAAMQRERLDPIQTELIDLIRPALSLLTMQLAKERIPEYIIPQNLFIPPSLIEKSKRPTDTTALQHQGLAALKLLQNRIAEIENPGIHTSPSAREATPVETLQKRKYFSV